MKPKFEEGDLVSVYKADKKFNCWTPECDQLIGFTGRIISTLDKDNINGCNYIIQFNQHPAFCRGKINQIINFHLPENCLIQIDNTLTEINF